MQIPTVLIAQFGKNDHYANQITGEFMMASVLAKIEEVCNIIGTKIVLLDSVNNGKVIQFYQNFGFQAFGMIVASLEADLQPMFLDVSK